MNRRMCQSHVMCHIIALALKLSVIKSCSTSIFNHSKGMFNLKKKNLFTLCIKSNAHFGRYKDLFYFWCTCFFSFSDFAVFSMIKLLISCFISLYGNIVLLFLNSKLNKAPSLYWTNLSKFIDSFLLLVYPSFNIISLNFSFPDFICQGKYVFILVLLNIQIVSFLLWQYV